jgi:hypothetical protein
MKEVELTPAIKLADHKGKTLTGYYIGKRKVETKTESGESLLHLFQEKDGTEIEIWSFEQLKRKLAKVPLGSLVKMEYTGTEKDGDRSIHQVKVYYDEKDKININD